MPTVNIPPRVRFVLYLVGAVALLTVTYALAKGWVGKAEVAYVTGLAALLHTLAAAKTDLSKGGDRTDGHPGRHQADTAEKGN